MHGRRDAKNTQRSTGQPQGLLSQRYNPQGPPSWALGGKEAQAGWGTDNQSDTSLCDTPSRWHRPGPGWTTAGGLCGEVSAKQGHFSDGSLSSAEG